jgi:hypothetical protein
MVAVEASAQLNISINRRWPAEKLGLPPAERRWGKYNGSFVAEERTPISLLDQITQGYSFTAVLGGCQGACCGAWCTKLEHKKVPDHCGRPNGYRRNQHFQSAQFIALDFDTGDERSSFEYLLEQPLIAHHGGFLYTTLSHTPDCPKGRVVFITDAPFSEPDQYRRAKWAVMAQLPWGDASVHDPARLFYGSHPHQGRNRFLGNVLHLSKVDQLVEQHRIGLEAEQPRRELPRIQAGRVMGATPAERYVNTAIQQEAAWVSSRIEGTGERHKGLLISAMKLASLSLSEWLPPEVCGGIDPHALLLPAAHANGYVSKYGESAARQTISDGIAYARPRLSLDSQNSSKPRLRWSGGQWVKAVRA